MIQHESSIVSFVQLIFCMSLAEQNRQSITVTMCSEMTGLAILHVLFDTLFPLKQRGFVG